LLCAAAFVLGGACASRAIDFSVKGSWDMYFNFGQSSFYKSPHDTRNTGTSVDLFEPDTLIRIQLDAVASESLSGSVQFEIGVTTWGSAGGEAAGPGTGGALGTDGVAVKVRHAFIDWVMPNTDLRTRMGLQSLALPNVAGGSAILDDDGAGITVSYQFNDNAGLALMWARPYNDNYITDMGGRQANSFLDNMDLVMLSVPLSFEGISLTPWAMLGFAGDNVARSLAPGWGGGVGGASDAYVQRGIFPVDVAQGRDAGNMRFRRGGYSTMFWVGLPITIEAFDPFSFELDINYGYSSGWGRYDDGRTVFYEDDDIALRRRNDTRREGFLIKALAEYKTDWGTPGIFGWYASGDDGNTRNGSERMPTVSPAGTFTSFGLAGYEGDFNRLWTGETVDTTYTGTWGIGAQISELSFLEDLSHTVRIAYWRGTNDPAMARALSDPEYLYSYLRSYNNTGWNQMPNVGGLYLTKNDYLVEFNLDSKYQIYENLEAILELAYIVNGVDKNTWKWTKNQKEDAWKCALLFRYSF
jgi:hypothetical protein